MNKKWMFVVLGYVLLLAALGVTLDGSLALIAIDRLAPSQPEILEQAHGGVAPRPAH
jgi:hypothetical protein